MPDETGRVANLVVEQNVLADHRLNDRILQVAIPSVEIAFEDTAPG